MNTHISNAMETKKRRPVAPKTMTAFLTQSETLLDDSAFPYYAKELLDKADVIAHERSLSSFNSSDGDFRLCASSQWRMLLCLACTWSRVYDESHINEMHMHLTSLLVYEMCVVDHDDDCIKMCIRTIKQSCKEYKQIPRVMDIFNMFDGDTGQLMKWPCLDNKMWNQITKQPDTFGWVLGWLKTPNTANNNAALWLQLDPSEYINHDDSISVRVRAMHRFFSARNGEGDESGPFSKDAASVQWLY